MVTQLKEYNIDVISVIGIWMILSSVFGLGIAVFLLFSERVNKYFGT